VSDVWVPILAYLETSLIYHFQYVAYYQKITDLSTIYVLIEIYKTIKNGAANEWRANIHLKK
jgi:hypothetical protein